eukprot:2561823-Rhodomonas_salina.1
MGNTFIKRHTLPDGCRASLRYRSPRNRVLRSSEPDHGHSAGHRHFSRLRKLQPILVAAYTGLRNQYWTRHVK